MESSESVTADTPGARLRAAREALGISPREMADRLNWLPAHVSVIEEDRFEEFRGAAFIRGYLRAYARALNLDEDEIVASYAAMYPDQEKTPAPAPAPASIAASGQKTGWSVLFGIVVSVMIIAGIWWQQQTPAPSRPAAQTQPAAQEQAAGAPGSIQEAAAEPSRPDTSAGLVPELKEVPPDTAAGEPEQVAEDHDAGPVPASAAVAEAPVPAQAAAEPAVPAASEDVLEFQFTDDCWLEVRDGDDQLIYADLHGAGDRFSLDGKPPFRILAGNAAALTLSYRGEPVEVVTRPGRDSARFTVGQR